MIAALFVLADGPYPGRPGVDAWPETRDARTYPGPWPVVAHPPCQRWGRFWSGGPTAAKLGRRRKRGDDGDCFAAALAAVERWGGVLEHPADSSAWVAFAVAPPPRAGGWVSAGLFRSGRTCHVEQGHYGHRARKPTWLYAVTPGPLPELIWGPSVATARVCHSFKSTALRHAARAGGRIACEVLSHRQRCLSPEPFADVLLAIAAGGTPHAQ